MKNQNEKEITFFQRLIFWVLIPLLFALFLGLLIASIAGVNVFQTAKDIGEKIPFIHKVDKEEKLNIDIYEDKINSLNADIKNKNARIEQLTSQLDKKEKENERVLLEKKQLEETIEELKQMRDQQKRELSEIIKAYETMNPKKSAPIILAMKDEQAIKILSNMSTDSLAKILENMPAEQAAKYMEQLSTNSQ